MAKPNQVQKQISTQRPHRPSKTRRPRGSNAHTTPSKQPAKGCKQASVLKLLNRPGGTTVAGIVKATGWKPHTVRGFFTAIVRGKFKLALSSEKVDGKRVYHIAHGSGAR